MEMPEGVGCFDEWDEEVNVFDEALRGGGLDEDESDDEDIEEDDDGDDHVDEDLPGAGDGVGDDGANVQPIVKHDWAEYLRRKRFETLIEKLGDDDEADWPASR